MSMQKKANLVGTLESLLKAVGAEESTKRAEAYTEAGGYQGGTTHPVKDVDDRTEAASEGARSAENTDDAKNEPNRGPVVDSASEGPGAGQDSVQMDVGITSKATGEDSSAETDSAKDGKQDPGSSHPARTDNEELDGHKYASTHAKLSALVKKAEKLGEEICAWIATNVEKKAAPAKASAKKAEESAAGSTNSNAGGVGVSEGPITEEGKVEARDEGGSNAAAKSTSEEKIGQAGYDLAGIFADMDVSTEDKMAADHLVVDTLGTVIETALRRAEKCAMFYSAHFDPRNQKLAEGEEGNSEGSGDEGNGGGEESGAGQGAPAQDAGAGGAGPTPEEEALLMQLLQGGEGMGAGDALGGMGGGAPGMGGGGGAPGMGGGGGDPMMAGLGGGGGAPGAGAGGGGGLEALLGGGGGGGAPGMDPMMAGGGGDPMAAAGGGDPMAGGAGGGAPDAAMLEQILAELGISPEEAQAKVSEYRRQKSANYGCGPDMNSGKKKPKWQPKTAADREKYARMKQVITEITGRSSKGN